MSDKFSFHEVTEHEIRQEILKLDCAKATPVGDIPAGMLKSIVDIHASIPKKIINLSLRNGCFPYDLKIAVFTNIYEK